MRRALAVIAVAAALPAAARAQSPLVDTLTRIGSAYYTAQKLPGLAIGVIANGQVVYRAGFGTTRLGGGQPVTPSTLFHMASITKPFVATAVMQLANAGKVDIDAPVARYVPYFRMKDPRASSITVRQLLTHTAGMPDVTDYRWNHPEYDDGSLERYVRGLADSTLIAAPGAKFEYSNIGFEVLAELVAKVSGQPFERYVQQRILTPLAMRRSTLLMSDIDSSLMAWGHVGDARRFRPAKHYPYNRRHAASSTLHSNVDDMLRWAAANLQRGTLDGATILPASTYDELWTPQRVVGRDFSVGLSWFIDTRSGTRLVRHSGGDDGFRTELVLAPDQRVAVVVLTNSEANTSPLARSLIDAVLAGLAR